MCRYSVIDTIRIIFPGMSEAHPKVTWLNISKEDHFQGPDFSTNKFPGQGQRDTPVATMEGVLKIIDHFDTPVARQLKAPQREIFMRAMRGETIDAAEATNQQSEASLAVIAHGNQLMASAVQDIARVLTARLPAMEMEMGALRNTNLEQAVTVATMEAEMRGLKRRCEEMQETNNKVGDLEARLAKVRRVEELLDKSKLSVVIRRVTGKWPGSELKSVGYDLQETYKMVFEEAPRKLERDGYMSNAYFVEQMVWVEDFVRDWYARK